MYRLANPPRKQKTREQVEKMKEKAARFSRGVIGDEDKAREFEGMSTEEYAEHKKIELVNPARRRAIVEHAVGRLPFHASTEDRLAAIRQGREAVRVLPLDATELDILQAASDAVRAVAVECERRHRKSHWLSKLSWMLPFGSTEDEEAEARKIVTELLNSLPVDLSDSEVKEEIRRELRPLTKSIELRERKKELLQYGKSCVDASLSQLYKERLIDSDERYDREMADDLVGTVEETLDEELSGQEEYAEVSDRVTQIVEDELGVESDDDE